MGCIHKVVAVAYIGRPWEVRDDKDQLVEMNRNFKEVPQATAEAKVHNSRLLETLLNQGWVIISSHGTGGGNDSEYFSMVIYVLQSPPDWEENGST